MKTLRKWIFLFFCSCLVIFINADDIDRTARKGVVIKLLREMVNQTKADTLNLPANASSIRENITDTFSCDNRTYGYYADVDNECQIFHVCLTSRSAGGRSVTYRWSFICPNETLFNQEVLTCTRPRDSIPCEESPMFYHLNDEIGKVPNDTDSTQMAPSENMNNNNNNNNNHNGGNINKNNIQRRKPVRKQNMIVENLMKEVMKENLAVETFDAVLAPVVEETLVDSTGTQLNNQETSKNTEFDDVMIESDVTEINERRDRIKTPIKPIGKEIIKKQNKRKKDALKPLAAMMGPEIESDEYGKPQKGIVMTPMIINPDNKKETHNKDTKPMIFQVNEKETSEDIFKVMPQENNEYINSKPAKENKIIKVISDVNDVKPINKQSNNKEYSLGSQYKYSKETIYEGALKQPIKTKSDKETPVTKTKPEIHEVNAEYKMNGKRTENARLASERNLKRIGKKLRRGSIRFRADKV